METNEKIYCSQQLCCMLPPLAFKVMFYLIGWNKQEIKYYEKQMCKFLHLEKEELQLAIQTLIDNHLIDVSLIEHTWIISVNRETVKRYFNVKMDTIVEHEGLKLAKAITWNQVEETNNEKKSASWEDLSESQLEKLIQRLQVIKNEKAEVNKVVVGSNKEFNDLPF